MLTDAIRLALKHGTYVFDENGIIDRENATFCYEDGDFTPNYSRKDFVTSEAKILATLFQNFQAMSPQDDQLRRLGPHYVSTLLSTMHRKDALRSARKQTFLPVEPAWSDRETEYELTLLGTWLMQKLSVTCHLAA